MKDFLITHAFNSTLFSILLVLVVFGLSKGLRAPKWIHALWVLVLIKVLIPPVYNIPLVNLTKESSQNSSAQNQVVAFEILTEINSVDEDVYVDAQNVMAPTRKSNIQTDWFLFVWFIGAMGLLCWSCFRIYQFNKLLITHSKNAPDYLIDSTRELCSRFGIRKLPEVLVTSARISPMVWWIGGKVHIVMPTCLLNELDFTKWNSVLAHELAHVKRKDYLIRLVEWIACVVFWWNPLIWVAQRNLRATEEICCDALVLSHALTKPVAYANALLSVMEIFAKPVTRPPAFASKISSDGFIERRFKMIVKKQSNTPDKLKTGLAILAAAMVIMPTGLVVAQDVKAVERRLNKAVKHGEISFQHAAVMLEALHKTIHNERRHHEEQERLHNIRHEEEEIHRLIRERKISHEEAEERLEQLHREHGERNHHGEEEARHRHLMQVERELDHLVREGKISAEEAEEKLMHLHREIEEGRHHEEEARHHHLMQVERELDHLVREGKISAEEAEEKLMLLHEEFERHHARKEDHEHEEHRHDHDDDADEHHEHDEHHDHDEDHDEDHEGHDDDEDHEGHADDEDHEGHGEGHEDHAHGESHSESSMDHQRARYLEAQEQIKQMVEKGYLSEKDAKQKLQSLRQGILNNELRLHGRDEAAKQDESRRMLERLMKERRMAELQKARAKMAAESQKDLLIEQQRRQYMKVRAEIEQLVENGTLSKKRGEEKLAELKKALQQNMTKKVKDDSSQTDDRKRRYMQAEAKLKAMVANGEVSREVAEARLNSYRKQLEGENVERAQKEEDLRKRYTAAIREIEKALKAGKISEDQAKDKMIQVRRKLSEIKN